jgi:hypothetical protein
MYTLVLFYIAYKQELEPSRPFPKLLAIKAVVFFSFWQACLITLLGMTGAVQDINSNCTPGQCKPNSLTR